MYNAGTSNWLKHRDFLILDILFVEISYMLGYYFRFGTYENWPTAYTRIGILLFLLDIVVAFLGESYTGILKRTASREMLSVGKHVSAIMMLCLFYLFCVKETAVYSRIVIGETWLLAIGLVYIGREIRKRIVRRKEKESKDVRNILLVADLQSARNIMKQFSMQYGMRICSVLVKDHAEEQWEAEDILVLHDVEKTLEYMRSYVVDDVFIHMNSIADLDEHFLKKCYEMGVAVHIHWKDAETEARELKVEEMAGYPVITSCLRLVEPRQLLLKRLVDIVGSMVGLCVTAILAIVIGPLIFIQSPGSIFFSQMRIGKNGRKFKMYKFRTMYLDAEDRKEALMRENKMCGQMFKMDNDPRVFPIGRFLRKTSLDEFPQMWNVLKGDMSLVGTRPCTADEYEQYELRHKKRLVTQPGITGLWQVSGRSDILDFEEVVKLDTKYISEWTLGMDWKILWKTICVVWKREGSV